jgi:hypothetical protein
MPGFRVHIGFELPFWLALREGEYAVTSRGDSHVVSISNSVNRVEIGDFYLGSQAKGVIWCHDANGEATRQELQRQNPNMPITRHALKTVVTHVREVEAIDEQELRGLYEQQKKTWVDESFELVNRLIDAYSLAALDDKTRGEVGRVAFWDTGFVIVSFWDQTGSHQLWGQMEAVRAQTPPPQPFDNERQRTFEGLVALNDEYPLPRLLSVSAWGQMQRGNYRAAIVDDFNAIELAVSDLARDLAQERQLSGDGVDGLLKRLAFETICRELLPFLGGPKLAQWDKWQLIKEAQEIRNRVVHRGAHATLSDARTVHDAAIWTLTYLIGWSALQEDTSVDAPGSEETSTEPPA